MESVSSEVYRRLMLNKHDTVENILQVIEGFKTAGFNKSLSREENNVYVAAAVDKVDQSTILERNVLICFNCGKKGHRSTDCFSKGATSKPLYSNRNSTRQIGSGRFTSHMRQHRNFDNRGKRMNDRYQERNYKQDNRGYNKYTKTYSPNESCEKGNNPEKFEKGEKF